MINNPDGAPTGFFALWIGLGLAAFLFFKFNRNVRLKRRIFPIFVIGVAVIFVWFAVGKNGPALFVIPAVALITLLNLWTTRFCGACSEMVGQRSFIRPKFCPKCGGALDTPRDHGGLA